MRRLVVYPEYLGRTRQRGVLVIPSGGLVSCKPGVLEKQVMELLHADGWVVAGGALGHLE